jgi:cytochrome c oxidase assembly protein subunit 15
MPRTQNRAVMKWLFFFAAVVVMHTIFGGYVRLSRSGLSITEWNPIMGTVPPLNQQDWQAEFAKYQKSPEFIKVNSSMTLDEYKFIFFTEWLHRLVARLIGLIYAIPVFYFLFTKKIPLKEFGIYFLMGMLIIAEAFMGWYMVSSGLIDRPSVSHLDLTAHLLLALSLLGLSLWTAFGHKYGFPDSANKTKWSTPPKLTLAFLGVLLIQISYGGFTAGLKAGHVSDTWPLMFGKLIPPNLFNSFIDIFESPQTIVFIHRWFAFIVLAAVVYVYYIVRKTNYQNDLYEGFQWLAAAVVLQITLGILTILSNVNIVIAMMHQAGALILFVITVYFIHRFRALDVKA